jgi:hypothetical protein
MELLWDGRDWAALSGDENDSDFTSVKTRRCLLWAQSRHGLLHCICPLLGVIADIVCRLSATGTKKQMIGSLQQHVDAARLEFVWQLIEMNDADGDAR